MKKYWKIIDVHHFGNDNMFCIDCGKFGIAQGSYEIEWEHNGVWDLENLTNVHIQIYDLDWPETGKLVNINKRNVELICEFLEEEIYSDPEHYGYDVDKYYYED